MKREFLLLAHNWIPEKHGCCGFYLSEKLDGMRCFWDGGITRGMSCLDVPWANTTKHARYVNAPRATGLWTRYAQPIQAPDSWLDKLPQVPLDGELSAGHFQDTVSICKQLNPISWAKVKYYVFDSPSLEVIFRDGDINNTNFKKRFRNIIQWLKDRKVTINPETPFYKTLSYLNTLIIRNDSPFIVHKQLLLPGNLNNATDIIKSKMEACAAEGKEGMMLRGSVSFWKPERSYDLLKIKVFQDAEATVVGYRWGKPTDVERSVSGNSTDRLVGLMGSVLLDFNGKRFELGSGFTLEEREMVYVESKKPAFVEGNEHPGYISSDLIENPKFPKGSKITFRYRELTRDGIPKEARYLRKYEGV